MSLQWQGCSRRPETGPSSEDVLTNSKRQAEAAGWTVCRGSDCRCGRCAKLRCAPCGDFCKSALSNLRSNSRELRTFPSPKPPYIGFHTQIRTGRDGPRSALRICVPERGVASAPVHVGRIGVSPPIRPSHSVLNHGRRQQSTASVSPAPTAPDRTGGLYSAR